MLAAADSLAQVAAHRIIRGTVCDAETGKGIGGAIVLEKDSSGERVAYAITVSSGDFVLRSSAHNPETYIEVKSMGYATTVVTVGERAGKVVVGLKPQPTLLRDVKVVAPDIRRRSDTLSYSVSRYARPQDRRISDVLKRLPGIKVESDGSIIYNGEPINRFYIDGSDFMDGRYSLATENIAPSDVKSVEVLENHQPVKALQDIEFSRQAGINIRLTDDARQRWAGAMETGIGCGDTGLLYDASLFAMRIGGARQTVITLKADDTGWNPSTTLMRHTVSQMFSSHYVHRLWTDGLTAENVSYPIPEARVRDNHSLLANISNQWKAGKDTDIKLNVSFIGDKTSGQNDTQTDYLNGGIPDFTQTEHSSASLHQLCGRLGLVSNKPSLYLSDNLYADVKWNDFNSGITGSRSLSQDVGVSSVSLVNDLQAVRRIGSKLLTISSRNSLSLGGDELVVSPYDSLSASFVQRRRISDFRSTTEARYGWSWSRWTVNMLCGIDMNLRRQDIRTSCWTGKYLLTDVYAGPEFSHNGLKVNMKVVLPVSFRTQHSARRDGYKCVAIAPALNIRWKMSAKLEMICDMRYSRNQQAADMLVDHALMKDYRNMTIGLPTGELTTAASSSLSFRYRNPSSSLFSYLSAAVHWYRQPLTANQLFGADIVISTYSQMVNDQTGYEIKTGVSKGFAAGRGLAGIDARMLLTRGICQQNSVLSDFALNSFTLSPYFKYTPSKWLSADYACDCSLLAVSLGSDDSSTSGIIQKLTATVVPSPQWRFAVGGEHHVTWHNSHSSGIFLLDLSLEWNISSRMVVSFKATNLLDYRTFSYNVIDSSSLTSKSYAIRGRNLMLTFEFGL